MVSKEAAKARSRTKGRCSDAGHLARCCVFVDVLHPITRQWRPIVKASVTILHTEARRLNGILCRVSLYVSSRNPMHRPGRRRNSGKLAV